jgi:hypothetical protein
MIQHQKRLPLQARFLQKGGFSLVQRCLVWSSLSDLMSRDIAFCPGLQWRVDVLVIDNIHFLSKAEGADDCRDCDHRCWCLLIKTRFGYRGTS